MKVEATFEPLSRNRNDGNCGDGGRRGGRSEEGAELGHLLQFTTCKLCLVLDTDTKIK